MVNKGLSHDHVNIILCAGMPTARSTWDESIFLTYIGFLVLGDTAATRYKGIVFAIWFERLYDHTVHFG